MAWANIVEEINVWTLTSLLWARVFGSSENSIETAASESHQACAPNRKKLLDGTIRDSNNLSHTGGSASCQVFVFEE
jgi:hypothetical protein